MKYLALCLAAIAAVGACGCGRHKMASTQQAPVSQRTTIDHSNVNSLVEGMDKALQQKDYEAIVACMQPDYRPAFRSMLKASAAYSKKMGEVSDMLDQRVDPAAGKRLRAEADETFHELVPSPLAGAVQDGKVEWNRVIVVPEPNDQVAVKVDGLNTPFGGKFFIVHAGDQWFIRPMEDPDTFAKGVKGLVKAYNESDKTLNKIEGRIKSGKINSDNVNAELWPKG